MGWITTKTGKRINTDWFDDDEKNKQRQIAGNKQEADKKNNKPVTEEDIKAKLIKADSYTNDPKYKKLSDEVQDAIRRRDEVKARTAELQEQLKKEQTIKPKSEWTTEDEIADLLGERPVKYTEKGKQLKAELDESRKKYKEADHEWSEKSQKLISLDKAQRDKQKQEWAIADKDISMDVKSEYPGFKVNESTTTPVDEALKSGKAIVVEMSPETYLHEVAHNIFPEDTIESTLRGTSVKNINKYMQMMKDGTKFDTPYLNYRTKGQEGRHRAIAAMMLGIKRIPVIVVRK